MDQQTKTCGKCQQDKPVSEFYLNRARYDGLSGYCIPCQRVADDASDKRKRDELLALLGGVCRRCGFDNPIALQVDHVNGGGAAERRQITSATHVLLRRVKEHPEKYQLLCANCNIIKRHEQNEHVGDRQYVRRIATERKPRDPGHVPKRRSDALARLAEMLPVIEQRRAEERSPVMLPIGNRWSRFYHRCLWCRRDDRRHAADGLCYACNAKVKANYSGAQ